MNVSRSSTASKELFAQTLSFDKIPGQSRLFLDYLKDPRALKKFYPSAIASHNQLIDRVPEVLANYTTDRNILADALWRMNKSWYASAQTFENIEILRANDSVAVVTGQQAGLFTGALYTIYKAVSAIKVAADLNQRKIKAVPVFWIASEDHDFAEVAATEILNSDKTLTKVEIATAAQNDGLQVGKIVLGESINQAIEKLFLELPDSSFALDLENIVRRAYQPECTLSESFARMMTELFGRFGLILLDPLDADLKKLAAPIYARAIEKSAEMTSALILRSRELEDAGYHAQVLVKEDSFPLFWNDAAGKRCALHRTKDNKITTKCTKHKFEISDLTQIALETPERLSPNATLRATVQDYLLPTIAYLGGAAEIAYFAQSSEVYRILQRPITPIFHRASVTIVELHEQQILTKYNLSLTDFFAKQDCWLPQLVEDFLNPETTVVFAEAEASISAQLDALKKKLNSFDPTLAQSLARRRPKIQYHLDAARTNFYKAEIKKNEAVKHELETVCTAVFPHKSLQERSINASSLIARRGDWLLEYLWQTIDIATTKHQILFL